MKGKSLAEAALRGNSGRYVIFRHFVSALKARSEVNNGCVTGGRAGPSGPSFSSRGARLRKKA